MMIDLLFPEKNKVDEVAQNILEKRYFKPGETTWEEVAKRVVDWVVPEGDDTKLPIFNLLLHRYFIPNSPTLVNAGTEGGGLSGCYVVDFPDSIEGIYKTKLDFALIARKGGGCGTTLSKLRPEKSRVSGSTHGYAGGPVNFFNTICTDMEVITQAGFREMAMMGVMSVYAPDIVKFITAKTEEGKMSNTNISVLVDNEFMEKVEKDEEYQTYFDYPDRREYGPIYRAREIFEMIVEGAWKNGEPGLLFKEKLNNSPYQYTNQTIDAVNPCVIGDTLVHTVEGRIKIKDLVGQEIDVFCMNEEGKIAISTARNIRKTRENSELILIHTTREDLVCTPDHLVFTMNRGWVRADELLLTDKLKGINKKMHGEQKVYVGLTETEYVPEHRFIASHYYDIEGMDVHHVDGNHMNNTKSNLSALKHHEHSALTSYKHDDWTPHGPDGKYVKKKETKKKVSYNLNYNKRGVRLKIKSIEKLEIKDDVYDLEVDNYHNFIANGLVIHNCGEMPLPANGVCNLGSLDILKFYDEEEDDLNYIQLELAVRLSVRFLDMVIDRNSFPTPEITEWALRNRPVGLGIFGLADYFLKRKLVYGSEESLKEIKKIMGFIYTVAEDESITLGEELGVPEECKKLPVPRRNITLLSIAPTGSISLLGGSSSGIEPIFSEVTVRKDNTGTYNMIHPESEKEYFRCAVSANGTQEVNWREHILVQDAVQEFVDSGVSKCIEAGTIIPTNKGLIRIEDFSDVIEDDSFVDISKLNILTNGSKITNHYRAGLKESTEILLDNGATIVGATESHRLLTSTGWKTLKDIVVGDVILGKLVKSHGVGGENIYWDSKFNTNSNKINIPKKMTPHFAEFVGMISSDGHCTESTGFVGISCKNDAVEAEFKMLCESIFGVSPNEIIDKRNGVKSLYITSRNLSRFMIHFIGTDAYNKFTPKEILLGNEAEKLSYLRGISLDGYLKPVKRGKEKALCIYGGMSKKLAYSIAEICRSFGVPKVYQGQKVVKGFGVEFYVVVSNELQELIKCIEPHKNSASTYIDYNVYISRNDIENKRVPLKHKHYFALKNLRILDKKREYCFSSIASGLGFSTEILANRVTKVTGVGLKELFDIEVEDSHSYVINGVISHNTINFPNHTRRQTIYDAFTLAWKLPNIKGMTVYRNGSRIKEVLSPKNLKRDKCPVCDAELIKESGCKHCSVCDFSVCEIG